jgi:hypothetical protein
MPACGIEMTYGAIPGLLRRDFANYTGHGAVEDPRWCLNATGNMSSVAAWTSFRG